MCALPFLRRPLCEALQSSVVAPVELCCCVGVVQGDGLNNQHLRQLPHPEMRL